MIITYCSETYEECLKKTSPSWGENVFIYSDTSKFGYKMFDPVEDMDENLRRKILVIKNALTKFRDRNIVFLDVDIYLKKSPIKVFENNADLTVTRMIRRDRNYDYINSGVTFWRSSKKMIRFCDKWLEIEELYRKENKWRPEQLALNNLAIKAYDEMMDITVSNVSENIYNFERNSTKEFISDFNKYKPKLIHLKNKMWKNEKIINYLKK